MFAIKIIPDKKKPEQWFLLRDPKDFVVYCWNEKEDAEKAMSKLEYEFCEVIEDIPSGAADRFIEKRESNKIEEKK